MRVANIPVYLISHPRVLLTLCSQDKPSVYLCVFLLHMGTYVFTHVCKGLIMYKDFP